MALNWQIVLADSTGIPGSGTTLTKAKIEEIRDTINNEVRCSAYHNTTQSIADSTWTALSLNSEDYDVGTMHSTSVNTSRITVPTNHGGLYLVSGKACFGSNATGFRGVAIYKNGSPVFVKQLQPVTGSLTIDEIVASIVLVATDYLEVFAFQNSGGALNVGDAARQNSNHLQLTKIR